ncbi:MAG: hypothetical protein WBV71_18285, partial [Roseobacter sp.]
AASTAPPRGRSQAGDWRKTARAPDAILTQALKDGTPLKTIAADKKCTSGFIRKRDQLAFLSPRIQTAIRDGTLPPSITTDHILRQRIPLDWMMQERMFGV